MYRVEIMGGRRQITGLTREHAIQFAGNRKLKIYGSLSCNSGKRMKIINRFFLPVNRKPLITDTGHADIASQ
jgi:hypothetical protein